MNVETEVRDIVFEALANLNDELPAGEKVDISYDTLLFGGESTIDSLSLVSVIVDVETALSTKFDRAVALTDDRAMSREPSPFTSARTLSDYVVELLGE
ncbi:hypothetical protein [Methylorubrum extorquens]|uniref:hypothetical protein n=1 Tax=Methylorubrum extorquens TaxID=408 RepID=UPI001EE53A32|nr:hypothetical protein [Methylorubrum extorquens]MCG5247845.1 hypothetical protein [Methylorubrum extorquens]